MKFPGASDDSDESLVTNRSGNTFQKLVCLPIIAFAKSTSYLTGQRLKAI